MGLLHASGGRGGLTSCLGGELFAWGLASGGFACGLFGTGQCVAVFGILCDKL